MSKLTIEEAQMLTDLRSRMLANIQAGKPAFDGLTTEEYRRALDIVRENRSAAAKAGEAKKVREGTRKKKDPLATPVTNNPKFEKFLKLDLD